MLIWVTRYMQPNRQKWLSSREIKITLAILDLSLIHILVSNDDGIRATGITALIKALSSREGVNVYVCAPDGQRSGNSQSISLNGTVYVSEVKVDGAKLAWQTSGTPADCVKIGLQKCEELGLEIDMVFAGINMGSNVGKDTLYSGTVGAAKEAAVSCLLYTSRCV